MSLAKKNFIYNSLYQLLNICIPLITTPYLTRVIGADGIGIYAYSYSVAYFFVIFIMLGLNNYGNRKIAQVRESKEALSKAFSSIYVMQVSIGIPLCFLYFLYCLFIADNQLVAFALGMYVLSACFDINWFFWGLEKFKLTVTRNLIIKIATTVAIFLFVHEQKDTVIYCGILSAGFLISQLALWPYVKKHVVFSMPKISEVVVHIRPNLFLFITVIAVSLFKYMDKIMLGIMSDVEQVGYFEASEKIIQVPIAFITALGTAMLPHVSNMVAKEKKYDDKTLYRSILFAMFLSSSMCFGIMGIAKDFVPLFYGDNYETCIGLYLILLPSCLFLAFANVIRTQYLLPNERDKIYITSACVGAVVNLLSNCVLIPKFGSVGTAVSTLIAEMAVCLCQVLPIRREIPIRKYVCDSVPFFASGALMFLILFSIDLNYSMVANIICKIGLGVLIYCVALIAQLFLFKHFFGDIFSVMQTVKGVFTCGIKHKEDN